VGLALHVTAGLDGCAFSIRDVGAPAVSRSSTTAGASSTRDNRLASSSPSVVVSDLCCVEARRCAQGRPVAVGDVFSDPMHPLTAHPLTAMWPEASSVR
jgi:hypothetical protein